MDIREIGKKYIPFAPALSALLITGCILYSLSGYEIPSYAAEQKEVSEEESGKTERKEKKNPAAEEKEEEQEKERSPISVGSVTEASSYNDGTYYGTGTGFAGPLKVKVVVSGGKIASIQIVETSDDSAYLQRASGLIGTMIASQTTNVDTVSGATYSSAGIIQAVRAALSQAAAGGKTTEAENQTQSQNTQGQQATGKIPYKEGIYYGTAEGYKGDITVAVVIQEETMKAILVTEHEDDEAFFNRALDVADKILDQQDTDVDTVSGATYSSRGIVNAVRNALEEARKVTNGELQEEADTESLEQLLEEAEQLDETLYTEASWAVLRIRMEDAREAVESSDQDKIDQAEKKLRQAVNSLEKKDGGSTVYKDGTYAASVLCVPDEDEDFEPYRLSLKITVKNDRIISVTDIAGDGDPSNDSYIKRAAEGTSSEKGVVDQIIEKGIPEGIDAVSRATCSSHSIIEAGRLALEEAKTDKEGGQISENGEETE